VTTAPVALRAARARVGLHADATALAGLTLFVGALAAATWGTWGDLDRDTGYDVVAGARVADGELPYRDFTYYYGPLAPYVMGLVALIGGPGFWPAVGLGFVVALAIIGMTYAVARALVAPAGAFLAAALTAAVAFIPSNYSFILPHTNAAPFGTLLLLGLVFCAWRYAASARSRWAVGAGLCLGLLTLTKPEPVFAGLLAVAMWLALRSRAGLPVRRVAALVAAPAGAITVLAYGSLLMFVPVDVLVFENLWARDEFAAGRSVLLEARMPLTLESVVELLKYTLLYAAGAALLVLLGRGLDLARWRRHLIAAAGFAALLFVAACIAKPDGLRDGIYYVWGWVPLGALLALVVLLVRFQRRSGAWSARAQLELAAAVTLLGLAATTYNGFVAHGWRPIQAVYVVPFAALLIVRLHLVELARRRSAYLLGTLWVAFLVAASTGLTLKDARAESTTVRGPGGALAETPAEGGLYQAALAEIAARTAPGEPIFVAPLMTGLYPLSGHDTPLGKISMMPGTLPHVSDQAEAIGALDEAGVRLIVTDRREVPGYGRTSYGESFDRLLFAWIERNFDRVRTLTANGEDPRTLDIWLKKPQSR
jgi:Dolichyl-phosphate-mannose-protein mannosyltransferase